MKTSTLRQWNHWAVVGFRAHKAGLQVEKVLTGKPGPDRYIRIGFDTAGEGLAITTACKRARKAG